MGTWIIIIGFIVLFVAGKYFYGWMDSWEGVIVNKYTYTTSDDTGRSTTHHVIESYNVTLKRKEVDSSQWNAINLGDYMVKKRGNSLIEEQPIPDIKAMNAIDFLTKRLNYQRDFLSQRHGQGTEAVRLRAVDALAGIGRPAERVVSVLIDALNNDLANVRLRAANSLRKIGEPTEKIVPALIKALNDVDTHVRMGAAMELQKMGTPEARNAFEDYKNKGL